MEVTNKSNLETFRILHLVMAALSTLGGLFVLAYAFLFAGIFSKVANQEMPAEVFTMFKGIFIFAALFIVILGILNFLTAKYLKERKNRTFIIVTSVVNCLTGILGILLGIFTIIEVNKDYTKRLFDGSAVT